MKVRESTPPQETRRFSVADTRQQPLENQSVMVPSVSQSVTPFLQLSKVTLARVRVSTMASPIGRLYMCSMLSRVWAVRARGRAAAAQPPCPDTRASGGPSASRDSSTLVSTGYCSRRLDAIPSATHFYTKSQTAKQTASCCGLTKHGCWSPCRACAQK